jgi:hypothetical protein
MRRARCFLRIPRVPLTTDDPPNLAAYTGQTVLLSFRTIDDPNGEGTDPIPPGFWVDDIAVGGTTISYGSTLAGREHSTVVHPTPVYGFTVQLVARKTRRKSPSRFRRCG